MIKVRNQYLSLLMVLIFAFTVSFPAGAAFAADEAEFSSSYNYVSTGKKQNAGTVTVEDDDATVADAVYITLTLPDGVKFTKAPEDGDIGGDKLVQSAATVGLADSNGSYINVWLSGSEWKAKNSVKFDFRAKVNGDPKGNNQLDIDKDFTGNLEVNVDVAGVANNEIIWSISEALTIAKVSKGAISLTTGDVKKVSIGGDKQVAKILIKESKSGLIKVGAKITLRIMANGVEFSEGNKNSIKVKGGNGIVVGDGTTVNKITIFPFGGRKTIATVEVMGESGTFPGTITFDPIGLNIDPDVTDEIEIITEVDNPGGYDDKDMPLLVATVGDVSMTVKDLEDNDGLIFAGQGVPSIIGLSAKFTLATTDGSHFTDGDVISLKLNKGKFDVEPDVKGAGSIKLYDDNKAFYYTCKNDDDELEFSKFKIKLNNDDEPGDITLFIESDYGNPGEIVIAKAAKPYSVTADKPSITAEARGREAGDIFITENGGKALDPSEEIYVKLPSGVELSGKPKIEVKEGNGDAKIADYGKDFFVIEIIKKSSFDKPTTLRVHDIKYDTGKLALASDVELKFYGDIHVSDYDYADDSIMTTVANATIIDGGFVTASYKLGAAGVTIQNSRTLVQVNTLCDTLGLQKSWDETSKTAYFIKSGTVVAFPIGRNQIIINGNTIPVDQGGVIIDGATYATLRGIQSAFGGELIWDDENKTATFKFN